MAIEANTSPLTAKVKGEVAKIIASKNPEEFITEFSMIDGNESTPAMAANFMGNYNLLPNDALILSVWKLHQIPALASYDPDFEDACRGGNIVLLKNIQDFIRFQQAE